MVKCLRFPQSTKTKLLLQQLKLLSRLLGKNKRLQQAMEVPDPQREMFEQQMALEAEKLRLREKEVEQKGQLELEKIDSQERQTDVKIAADLREVELRDERSADTNLTNLARLVKESREQQ